MHSRFKKDFAIPLLLSLALLALLLGCSLAIKDFTRKPTIEEVITRAHSGHKQSQYDLGLRYERGDGVPKNKETAALWYKKSAEQGFTKAQNQVGYIYSKGFGVTQNHETSAYWYRKAAEQGYARAQNNLGIKYANGRGVSQSDEEAMIWYRKAAEQGYAQAQNNLAREIRTKKFSAQYKTDKIDDYAEVVYWFRKSAKQGNVQGQYGLSIMDADHYGALISTEEALSWHHKAAEGGLKSAQFNLAHIYDKGGARLGRDEEKATYWYGRAAKNNDFSAKEILAERYRKGIGVEQNEEKARYWRDKAVEQHTENLKKYDPTTFNNIEKLMQDDEYSANVHTSGSVQVDSAPASGVINAIRDDDWFAMEVEEGQLYLIEFVKTNPIITRDTGINIYDSSGEFISSKDNVLNLLFKAPETGSVFVEIEGEDFLPRKIGDYNFTVKNVEDDYTGNVDTAGILETNETTITGDINFGGDSDWFAITIIKGKTYNIAARRNTARTKVSVKLYNHKGKLVIDNSYSALEFTAKETGVFFIAIESNPHRRIRASEYSLKARVLEDEALSTDHTGVGVYSVDDY